ncbi:Gfo/Idh/MocA family protein [Marinibacterium profundimaris]|uniref:Gfo/Idh/MocA-like oxidoreductase N-terminal domain-containing protein n=1 Tax=Marinibacterium profundimaris TaxID=1679460 RepID=A0A225NIC4_9RHOB|nr:Gfo/Idh/MocA family oxidoreductase [Marinibacterium profundimaris]OWU72823.1 hypothetical protein ATO3_14010 [Marinibacterium profundimaris]
MPETVSIGVLGAGGIARRFVADLSASHGIRVSAIASRQSERARHCRDLGGAIAANATIYTDYEALLADPNVDAVYVALPNSLHKQVSLDAIAGGKAVLCEKPLADSAAAVREILEASQAAQVFCMENMWTRFLPVTRTCREIVAAGEIGDIVQFDCSLGYPQFETPGQSNVDPALGGGVLLDLGVYPISMALHFLGDVSFQSGAVEYSALGADRDMATLLTSRSGAGTVMATLRASHSAVLRNTMEIVGTRGRIEIDPAFIAANSARISRFSPVSPDGREGSGWKRRLKSSAMGRIAFAQARRLLVGSGKRFGTSYPGTGMQFAAESMAQSLRDGRIEASEMPMGESLRVLEIVESIRSA